MMRRFAVRELTIDEPLSSPAVRGMVCRAAQMMGVNVGDAIGSKPESDLYIDCSAEQIQDVIYAACELKNLPEEEFWDVVWEDAERDRNLAAEALAKFESERNREDDLVGLLDERTLANIHRYEVQYSNRFSNVLDMLRQLQSSRVGLRPYAPGPVEIGISESNRFISQPNRFQALEKRNTPISHYP